jgi:hypothetical protein
MSSHRLADKASCRSVFCKPFGMLTELAPPASAHLIQCLLEDILDLLLRDMEWQSGDQLQLP